MCGADGGATLSLLESVEYELWLFYAVASNTSAPTPIQTQLPVELLPGGDRSLKETKIIA
jgi:hypothetical protein